MAGATHAVPGGRRSWRQGSRGPQGTPQAANAWRWIFTLLCLALLIAFIVILFRGRALYVQLHVVTLRSGEHDRLVLPPTAYAREDCEALAKLADDAKAFTLDTSSSVNRLDEIAGDFATSTQDSVVVYVNAHGVSSGGKAMLLYGKSSGDDSVSRCDLSELLQRFQACKCKRKLLVLDCGRLAARPRDGMLVNEFARLVERDVKALNDKDVWVLLSNSVLETTGVSHGARRSLFSLAMEDGLRGEADRPANRGDEDGKVSLRELAKYVRNRFETWFPEGSPQTPLLLRGGEGVVKLNDKEFDDWLLRRADPEAVPVTEATPTDGSDKKDAVKVSQTSPSPLAGEGGRRPDEGKHRTSDFQSGVLPIRSTAVLGFGLLAQATPAPPAAKDAAAPEAAKPAEKTPAAAPSDGKTAEPVPAKTAEPATPAEKKEEAAPAVAKGPPDAATENRNILEDLWRWRDDLQNRKSAGGWSPIDYAPHQWRELNAYLIDFEQSLRAGGAYTTDSLNAELRQARDRLRDLHVAVAEDRDAAVQGLDETSIGSRLLITWNRYRLTPAAQSFRGGSSRSLSAAQSLRAYADALYLAPEYLRWLEIEGLRANNASEWRSKLGDLVQHLTVIGRLLEGERELETASLEALQQEADRLVELMEWYRSKQTVEVDQAAKKPDLLANQLRLENVLRYGIIDAAARKKARDALFAAPTPSFKEAATMNREQSGILLTRNHWERMERLLELEQSFPTVYDAALAKRLSDRLRTVKFPALHAEQGDAEQDRWSALHIAEDALREAMLPRRMEEKIREAKRMAATDDTLDNHPFRREAMLVEGVDARLFDLAIGDSPLLFFELHVAPQILERLEVVRASVNGTPLGPDSVTSLELRDWAVCEVTVERVMKQPAEVEAYWDFDSALLQVRRAEDKSAIKPRERFPLRIRESRQGTLTVEVQAKQERGDRPNSAANLKLLLAAGALRPAKPFVMANELPTRNVIDLAALRTGAAQKEASIGDGGTRLRPFANRTTEFKLALINRTGKEKEVQVELYAAARPERADWKPGRLFEGVKLFPGVREATVGTAGPRTELLAKSGRLKLPATEKAVPLTWPPPMPEAGATPAPAAAPPPAGPPPAKNVTHGFFCLIRSLDRDEPPLEKWLEIEAMSPAQYFDGELQYDRNAGRLDLSLKPRDLDFDGSVMKTSDAPADIAEKPYLVHWETTDPRGGLQRVMDDELKFDPQLVDLSKTKFVPPFMNIPAGYDLGRELESLVSLDDYPRAIAYRIPAAASGTVAESESTRKRAAITGFSVMNSGRVYRLNPPPPEPAEPGKEPKEQILKFTNRTQDDPLIFRAPEKGALSLKMSFEVDAPVDSFHRRGADAIELRLDDQLRQTFYADRSIKTLLAGIQPTGGIALQSQAGDYEIEERIGGIPTEPMKAVLRLLWNGETAKEDVCWFLVDGEKPVVNRLFATSVEKNGPLEISIEASDLSGIDGRKTELEIAFDKNGSGEWEPTSEPPVKLPPKRKAEASERRTWSATFEFPTADKEFEPGLYLIRARVTDKADRVSEWKTGTVSVRPPPPPPPEKKKPRVTLPPAGPPAPPMPPKAP